jgi:N-acetylglutamate synthase-like GNAT family acetyltransferase
MIQIRRYTSLDLEPITELMSDLGYSTSIQEMERRMLLIESNKGYFTFVATINNEVVGMMGIRQLLNYETSDVVTQISSLVVKANHQGKGIGSALLKYIEQWTRQSGSKILYLTSGINEDRYKAHDFYKKYGFEMTGYRFVKNI